MDRDTKQGPKRDWVEKASDWAAALGFNRVRVRWKLERLQKKVKAGRQRAKDRGDQVRYEHTSCPHCGELNDGGDKLCVRCGGRLSGRTLTVLGRLGLSVPVIVSVSVALAFAFIGVYARMLMAEGGRAGSLGGFRIETLAEFGGSWWGAVVDGGQWWRLGTSIFVHAGIWHLGFNVLALSQIGPQVEEIFGRGRTILLFVVTGLVASLVSLAYHGILAGRPTISIGASGAIMGLLGLLAGWGHRLGTGDGRMVRNYAAKWAVYVVVFGIFIGADNGAHIGGFVAGAVLGFALDPQTLRRSESAGIRAVQGVVGAVAAASFVLLAAWPSLFGIIFNPAEYTSHDTDEQCRIYREEGAEALVDRLLRDNNELAPEQRRELVEAYETQLRQICD